MARRAPDPLAGFSLQEGPTDSAKVIAAAQRLMLLGMMRMNRVQEPFIRRKNREGRTPRRRILESGEKCGKTRIGLAEDIAHAMGFRPWLDASDPDYRIDTQVPNRGMIGCETMAQSVEAKIRPELESLIPAHCAPEWKNDTTGALKSVTLRYDYLGKTCGSVIHIRSYNQPADSFRGIDPHCTLVP